jgi:hypothetical protein
VLGAVQRKMSLWEVGIRQQYNQQYNQRYKQRYKQQVQEEMYKELHHVEPLRQKPNKLQQLQQQQQ